MKVPHKGTFDLNKSDQDYMKFVAYQSFNQINLSKFEPNIKPDSR